MTPTWPIHGGIHPAENKHQSMQLPLADVSLPDELVLPLNMHLGAPAEPIVAVGDRVLTGQMIAEPVGPFSAAVHASSSGTVTAIEDRPLPHPSGMRGLCIVIATDGKDEWVELTPCDDYRAVALPDLVERIRRAGIAGMGGAGFPTAIKVAPKANQPIKTLILNGTECEPYITADDRLMQDFAAEVVAGAELLAHLLHQPEQILIGIEDNKPDAIAALKKSRAEHRGERRSVSHQISLWRGKTTHPDSHRQRSAEWKNSGRHRHRSAKRRHRRGRLARHCEGRAVDFAHYHGGGEALEVQRNVQVRLGTPIGHVLKEHGLRAADVARLIMGGPMMGFTLETEAVPVVKTTNCILAPTQQELPPPPPAQACIRCGLCAEACPASLLPQQLYWYADAGEHDKLEAYNLFDCIECGACAYVCPSSIPLVQYYRAAKGEIRQAREDKIKSDRSRERFAFRQERLAKAEAEKEAKRQERARAAEAAKARMAEQQAANPAAPANDPVAAAIARAKAQQQNAQQAPGDQREKLERQLASAKSRLSLCEEKIASAESEEQAEKFRAAVKAAELKVAECEQKLAALASAAPAQAETTPSDDPVAAAIARAQAKMTMSPAEKLQSSLESLQQRLGKAEEKLNEAKAAGDSKADALQTGVDKLKQKIADTEAELKALAPATPAPAPAPAEQDAAASAIARAQARAAEMANMSEGDKLREQLQSLTGRLEKARAKLATAEAEGSDHVDALRTGVDKLETKLRETQAKLENA
ncbi:electron transport complex protein RnfC [Simiduia agarivorans SA1 = DSM 21679]|uniref:Ion-translocating oxidoreductase complex subunit C n=1 Tax=Simiduia agarivorans (strain DSM 21679 / JCM 13881 / BCRC 17597 / SA1) TaxID=1117647 RepID=R9S554_SIMAS|nr:electron transport complex protein RnfC [Simiduia agarivorans SA1 = DSM 21679]